MMVYNANTERETPGGNDAQDPNISLGITRINRMPVRINVWMAGKALGMWKLDVLAPLQEI